MSGIVTLSFDPGQVNYRLEGGHGCVGEKGVERQFSYHADGGERPLRWVGKGLEAFGLTAGAEFAEGDVERARALMQGVSPVTGEQLIRPRVAVYEDAKVPLAPLLAAVAVAQSDGVVLAGSAQERVYAQMGRTADSKGPDATFRADEAGTVADAFGLDADEVWGVGVFEAAYANLSTTRVETVDGVASDVVVPRRKTVGNAGYDFTFTLPKSTSVLMAFAGGSVAARMEDVLYRQVERSVSWLESRTAYGMRGKHGGRNPDGTPRRASVVQGDGYAGWTMVHRAARPVDGAQVGDPHWHVHTTFANLTGLGDGKYGTVAAGGRDLMRHMRPADALYQAMVRRELTGQFGVQFARSERTAQWEIVGIPDATIAQFSKRSDEVATMLRSLGFDAATVSAAQARMANLRSRQAKGEHTYAPDATLQQLWRQEAIDAGGDPDAWAQAAFAGAVNPVQMLDRDVLVAHLTETLMDAESGATAHARRFTYTDALRHVADALPGGVASAEELEELTAEVLASPRFVSLTAPGAPEVTATASKGVSAAAHMRDAGIYTTSDVVDVERAILAAAADSDVAYSSAVLDGAGLAMAAEVAQAQQGFDFSGEQRDALHAVASCGRFVQSVQGAPGTGKTTLMRGLRVALEAGGFTVTGAATAAVAAHNLHAESGIASMTVDGILAREAHQLGRGLSGVDVLVVDEANLTEDRSRAALYGIARAAGTRIVEVGDSLQLRGVGVGSLFRRVHEVAGGVELTDNRRQASEAERAAIAAWRGGAWKQALASWADRGHVHVTQTAAQSRAAMLAAWRDARDGAPDAHTELRGLLMLAATNEQVGRLNEAAQEIRRSMGELGELRAYTGIDGQSVEFATGDYVILRANDKQQAESVGSTVLNGLRGVVTGIEPGGSMRVQWCGPGDAGTSEATVSRGYVERGGVQLAYAITVHKAEGLTVGQRWTAADGTERGGRVLVAGAGADDALLHVATSRHASEVTVFAGRDEVETEQEQHDAARPRTSAELTSLVVGRMAEQAARTRLVDNDRPVVADIDGPNSTEAVAWRDAIARLRDPHRPDASPADERRADGISRAADHAEIARRRVDAAERSAQRHAEAVAAGRGPEVTAHEQLVTDLREQAGQITQHREQVAAHAAATEREQATAQQLREANEQAMNGPRRHRATARERVTELFGEHARNAAEAQARQRSVEEGRGRLGDEQQQAGTLARLAEADTPVARAAAVERDHEGLQVAQHGIHDAQAQHTRSQERLADLTRDADRPGNQRIETVDRGRRIEAHREAPWREVDRGRDLER